MHLKVSLWMSAGWADFRSLGAYYDVTAVAAFPHFHLTFLEHFLRLHIVKEGTVTLFVTLFDGSYEAELRCQIGEAFLFGCLCEAFIHISPFIVFAFSGICKVLSCGTDATKFLKPHLSVLFLIVCSLLEDSGYLLEAVLLGT